MQNEDFVHLHVHSDYSLLDGACQVPRLVKTARDMGMRALALTDHGNLFGAVHFYSEAVKVGIKPIVGYEAYVAPGSRFDRTARGIGDASYHLTLLARNEHGYQNLLKLATTAYLDGFYYRPRIDKQVLAEHVHGLIGLSACLGGEIPGLLMADKYEQAVEVARFYSDLFGPDGFYLELQDHGIPEQRKVNPLMVRLAKELSLPLVATNDVHYMEAADSVAHEVLLCINTGKFLDDEKRLSFEGADHYFKSPAEMAERFKDFPEALANTRKVADLCNLMLDFNTKHMPNFHNDQGVTNDEYFDRLCAEGLLKHYGSSPAQAVLDRLKTEVGVIRRTGYISLYLIARDIINFARTSSIPVGPGRGSAAGSLVSYCLDITSIDPIRYGLLFERFLDESRKEAPDFDIDFCQEGRGRVLEYIRKRYGDTEVAQIITFGTLGARAAIRDVARVLRIPLDKTDVIAKKVPATIGITLTQALEEEPDLAKMRKDDPDLARLFDIALRLEGVCHHASKHAAGVVMADKPLIEYTPLARVQDEIATQYDMSCVDKVGLLKVDVLGLKTLTVLDYAVKEIARTTGVALDLPNIDLEDRETYQMLGRGESKGIFQMESSGFRDLLVRLQPDRFLDLIALVALYRPGPLGGGLVDSYVERKHGRETFTFETPVVEEILKDTYGVMVYQEQVMRIISRIGSVPISRAYKVVKAISKKNLEVIDAAQADFVAGAVKNGLEQKRAEEVFNQIRFFGGYGFNQSHSTCYAFIAYQTAYLKCHHTAAFMAALMTYESGNTDKIVDYVEECRRIGVKLLPPDVNASRRAFHVDGSDIRFGLIAVKGLGDKAIDSIVEARERIGAFKSIFDFCSEVDLRVVNRSVLETLIKCGAFDSLGARRSQLMAVIDRALVSAGAVQADRSSGQSSFFDAFAKAAPTPKDAQPSLPDLPEWSEADRLAGEKESLGFYITGHPLQGYGDLLKTFSTVTTSALAQFPKEADNQPLRIGAVISSVRFMVTRNGASKGQRMALLKLEDLEGSADAVLFSEDLKANESNLKTDAVVFLSGTLNLRRDTPSIVVNKILPVHKAREEFTRSVTIGVDPAHYGPGVLDDLWQVVMAHQGKAELYLQMPDAEGKPVTIQADRALSVSVCESFVDAVRKLLGDGHIKFHPRPAEDGGSPGKFNRFRKGNSQ